MESANEVEEEKIDKVADGQLKIYNDVSYA